MVKDYEPQTEERKQALTAQLKKLREQICAADIDRARTMLADYDSIEAELKLYPDWEAIRTKHYFKA